MNGQFCVKSEQALCASKFHPDLKNMGNALEYLETQLYMQSFFLMHQSKRCKSLSTNQEANL